MGLSINILIAIRGVMVQTSSCFYFTKVTASSIPELMGNTFILRYNKPEILQVLSLDTEKCKQKK